MGGHLCCHAAQPVCSRHHTATYCKHDCMFSCLHQARLLRAEPCNVTTDLQAMNASAHMGAVAQRCCAIVSVAHGGQILCDSATLEGIRGHLADLYQGCIRSDAQRISAAPSVHLCHALL